MGNGARRRARKSRHAHHGDSLFNFAKDQGLTIKKSQRWANRLTDVGVLTDNATRGTFASQVLTFTPSSDTFFTAGSILSFFLIGRPKEIVHKLMLAPFRVEDFNVPGDEQMRGVAGLRKISEAEPSLLQARALPAVTRYA